MLGGTSLECGGVTVWMLRAEMALVWQEWSASRKQTANCGKIGYEWGREGERARARDVGAG